jgi:hypothetical protein
MEAVQRVLTRNPLTFEDLQRSITQFIPSRIKMIEKQRDDGLLPKADADKLIEYLRHLQIVEVKSKDDKPLASPKPEAKVKATKTTVTKAKRHTPPQAGGKPVEPQGEPRLPLGANAASDARAA